MPEPVPFSAFGSCAALIITAIVLSLGGALVMLSQSFGWLLLGLGTMFLLGWTLTTIRERVP
ncbi:MAG: hypothetical protein EXR62_10755 [Chloroflexi bacterium]|nr:hypothetical protein [Chloroflexota bacterium]